MNKTSNLVTIMIIVISAIIVLALVECFAAGTNTKGSGFVADKYTEVRTVDEESTTYYNIILQANETGTRHIMRVTRWDYGDYIVGDQVIIFRRSGKFTGINYYISAREVQ